MKHDPALLRSLASRCEAGESGPDFDREIAESLGLGRCRSLVYTGRSLMTPGGPTAEIVAAPEWPPLTTSIDAQSILDTHIMYAIRARSFDGEFNSWYAESRVERMPGSLSRARAPTEALSRLATSFRSLAAASEALG